MTEFPINWDLERTITPYPGRNGYAVSNLILNNEWTIAASPLDNNRPLDFGCISHRTLPPQYVEICRKSTAGEVLVSGTLKLTRTAHPLAFSHQMHIVLERKFSQLVENGSNCTRIEFCNGTDRYYDYHLHHLTGNIKIHSGKQNIGKCDGENQIQSKSLTELSKKDSNDSEKGFQLKSLIRLSKNFEDLLDPKESYFSDVSLVCGSVAIPAHKAVLCARSPVFAAMFTAQMKENTENKVHITDVEEPILRAMLVHIYTGKTEDLNVASAGDLLFAADKYQLEDLKQVCSDYLKENMTLENVLNTLVLGHLHNKDLQACAMNFICESCVNISAIEETLEWKLLRKERSELAMDVLTALVKSKEKKLKR
ncbi:protein roadkill [Caerostris darwini]|uniref:Protein roadkill n=1 Tax=Caerostris darwini TaxID=1538125 RepID=A0AAV4S5H9_9ARAC|nr:protein roadkill [Caerostris darwini]